MEEKEKKPVEEKKEKKVETKKEEPKKEVAKKESKSTESKKKFDTSKQENKKTNSGIIIAIVAVVVVVLAIVAYVLFAIDSPTKAVNNMLNEAKTSVGGDIFSSIVQEESEEQELQKLIFNNLSWKVLSEKEEGDTATVEVEITNKDFKAVMNNLQQKAVKALLNGEDVNTEATQKYLLEELQNNEIENVTNTHTITLVKKDGKWEVSEENDFVNMLLPGLNEAIEALD